MLQAQLSPNTVSEIIFLENVKFQQITWYKNNYKKGAVKKEITLNQKEPQKKMRHLKQRVTITNQMSTS